jgi:hypothetical protein
MKRRGLSRAVGPKEAHHLAFADLEADVVDYPFLAK